MGNFELLMSDPCALELFPFGTDTVGASDDGALRGGCCSAQSKDALLILTRGWKLGGRRRDSE